MYAIDKDTKKARLLMNTKDDTDTYLRRNGVYAVTRDDQGNIWIGSYTGGVSLSLIHILWEVGVHIADVTHYVKEGSIIDKEAEKRATSVYLVDRTIPMLPERRCV